METKNFAQGESVSGGKFKKAIYWASVAVVGIVLGISLQFVSAWSEPTVAPPGGNIGAPINTGATTQTKTGFLNVTGGGAYGAGGLGMGYHSLNSNSNGWLYLGDQNKSVYGGRGFATSNLYVNDYTSLNGITYIGGLRLYKCPLTYGCENGTRISGDWASYGCVGQLSLASTCQNAWWGPASCTNNCTAI